MTLTDFLLARLAEDEAAAKAARFSEDPTDTAVLYELGADVLAFVRHNGPARVLADVEAKRRIVERCSAVGAMMPSEHLAQGVLHLLAQPYADHADFLPEWRVD